MSKEISYQIQMPIDPPEKWLSQAEELINGFAKEGFMLEQSIESLREMAAAGWLAVAILDDQVIGTAALTAWSSVLEFGAWAVEEEYMKHGVGGDLLEALMTSIPEDWQVITFGNADNSGPIFKKMGLKVLEQDTLPEELFEPCKGCNCDKSEIRPDSGQKCVDTVFDINSYFKGE